MKHSKRLAVVALGMLGTGLGTTPAVASPGGWEEQHFEWNETIGDSCDVPGIGSASCRERGDKRRKDE
jgi:hypothetical protein